MRLFARTTVALTLIVFCCSSSAATGWLSGEELEQSCDAFLTNASDSLCLAFVQGFIAGAGAGAAPLHSRKAPPEEESFTERAIRTRVGTRRLPESRSRDPDYCIDDFSALVVVETVATYLRDREDAQKLTTAPAVHEALVHKFPCDR